jgi:hypothetical protein
MLGFRVLMYASGLISACVYLANLSKVRGLTAEAHHLEEEVEEGVLAEEAAEAEARAEAEAAAQVGEEAQTPAS